MFRNKQKTNQNSSKFVKISTFLIPHTISSVCFGCFDIGSKHRNNLKTTETDWVSVCFGSNREKKINYFEDPLIENVFWFVSLCFDKVLFVLIVSILVRNTKTNWKKMFFGFAKQTEKQPKQIEFWFVLVRTENFFFYCFEDTLIFRIQYGFNV